MKKSTIPLLILCLLLSGCGRLPLLDQLFHAQADATTVGALFEDDFSEADSGWDHFTDAVGMTEYVDEAYHILVNEPITDLFATPGQTFRDTVIEVSARKVTGPTNNTLGVICRYQDAENFYAALISSDGYAGIFRVRQGKYKLLGHDEMIPVAAILGGPSANRIHFECIGNDLALAVNGAPVDAQQDKSYPQGDVGLIAGTFDETGVHIAFDDFKVWKP